MNSQAKKISQFLLRHVAKHPHDIVAFTAEHFDVTTTTVHRHLKKLIEQALITKTGQTKQTAYYLTEDKNKTLRFSLHDKLDEFKIWQQYLADDFASLPQHLFTIFEYFTTKVINNAIDHARGKHLTIQSFWDSENITVSIMDDGIGVFESIRKSFQLNTLLEAPLELSKGKVTTDPKNHTGEGIFFSSKSADLYTIEANGILFYIDNLLDDWSIKKSNVKTGSKLSLQIARNSNNVLTHVFQKFQDNETLDFVKTEIHVDLARLVGERLISRSQAKRIVRNLEGFTHIMLDFKQVDAVGQGFVDQIFRVYQAEQPRKIISYCNANEEVEFMIKRSLP